MKYFLILPIALLCLTGCNRKSSQAAQAPAPTESKPTVVQKTEFDPTDMPLEEGTEAPVIPSAESTVQSRYGKAALAKQQEAEKTGIPYVVAELRKTPCYGDCPVFTLQILSDYTLRYNGKQNVDLIGEYTGKLGFNPMLQLGPMASRAFFFRMEDEYPVKADEAPADLPATITTMDWRGRSHTVKHKYDGPEGLKQMEEYLLGLVNQAIWTPVEKEE